MLARLPLILVVAAPVLAQTPCEGTPAYSPCEIVFQLSPADVAAHPNPYVSAQLQAEFRSPDFKTYLMPAFFDGAGKMVLRFTPTEAGHWIYRITSNLAGLDGKEASFNAAASDAPGFVRPANVHHWATENRKPHLWMGYIDDRLRVRERAGLRAQVERSGGEQVHAFSRLDSGRCRRRARVFAGPDKPNAAYFDELDRRVLAIHKRGLTADLILASNPDYITNLFPDWQSRERFIRYIVARYAPMNITWQGVG